MEENLPQKSLLIIGAGGIGTTVVDLLVPALERIQLGAKITLMDGDTVEASNLGHQNYSTADIGKKKVSALKSKFLKIKEDLGGGIQKSMNKKIDLLKMDIAKNFCSSYRLDWSEIKKVTPDSETIHSFDGILKKIENECAGEDIEIIAQPVNLRCSAQLEGYDLVVVCVDRPEPRRLVHSLSVPWIDLRCSGDGWMVFTSDSDSNLVAQMTPDHEPMSCQVEGALDSGNLEFGFSIAGTFGAQWILQQLREKRSPVQSIGSLTYGSFEFPEVSNPSVEVSA